MTTEQIDEITADVQKYIKRKMAETGDDHNTVVLAITRATLLSQVEYSEQRLQQKPVQNDPLLDRNVTSFTMTVRTENVLRMNDIKTVRDLVRLHRADFLCMRSVGKRTMTELDDFLADHNLYWGMEV